MTHAAWAGATVPLTEMSFAGLWHGLYFSSSKTPAGCPVKSNSNSSASWKKREKTISVSQCLVQNLIAELALQDFC